MGEDQDGAEGASQPAADEQAEDSAAPEAAAPADESGAAGESPTGKFDPASQSDTTPLRHRSSGDPDTRPLEPQELEVSEMATQLQELVGELSGRRDALDRMPDGPRPEGGPRRYKRRRIIVDPQVQLSHLSVYLATTGLLLLGFVAYYLTFTFQYRRALNLGKLPGATQGPDFEFIATVILVFVVLIGVGMALYAILQSHRFAGPALRFRRALRQIRHRDYDWFLQLRRADYMKGVAEHVNLLNHALKAKDLVLVDAALRLDALCAKTSPEVAEKLREVVADLGDVVLPIPDEAPE
jgi:hypothetical protein